ncbi:hypothetical protein L596_018720 [Steinernema carpocapsae]|nr:hypothetical protein L596_018720 [Steinernema carpocapsae]
MRTPKGNLGVPFQTSTETSVFVLRTLLEVTNSFLDQLESERLEYCQTKLAYLLQRLCASPSGQQADEAEIASIISVCRRELKNVQGNLIAVQSSFDTHLIIISLLSSSACLVLYAKNTEISSCNGNITTSILDKFFLLLILLEPIIYFASSLTEEEHDIWFFIYSSYLILNAVSCPHNAKIHVILLVIHRISRGFTEGRRRRWNLGDGVESPFPDLSVIFSSLSLLQANLIRCTTVAFLAYRRTSYPKIFLLSWILFVTRNEFVLLCLALVAAGILEKSPLTLFLSAQASFYYIGNSNSLSTIDISVGYAGLASYQPFIVAVQIALNAYSGPLIQLLLASPKAVDGVSDLVMASRLLSIIVTMISLFVQRYHLFVWTVFAPKFVIEAGHMIFVTILSLLVRV